MMQYSFYICWARYSAERWVPPESVGNGCVSKMGSVCVINASLCERLRSPSLLTAQVLSPHLLFPLFPVFSAVVHRKSPVLVGNLACIFLPTNPVCTKWRARGQVVCLLLIKPFDQSPFSSAHVALWAPPVCSVRKRTLSAEMKPAKRSAFSVLWNSSDTGGFIILVFR